MKGRQKYFFCKSILIWLIVSRQFLPFEELMFWVYSFGPDFDWYSIDSEVLFARSEVDCKIRWFLCRSTSMLIVLQVLTFCLLGLQLAHRIRTSNCRISTGHIEKTLSGLEVVLQLRFGRELLVNLFEGTEPDFFYRLQSVRMIWGRVLAVHERGSSVIIIYFLTTILA